MLNTFFFSLKEILRESAYRAVGKGLRGNCKQNREFCPALVFIGSCYFLVKASKEFSDIQKCNPWGKNPYNVSNKIITHFMVEEMETQVR